MTDQVAARDQRFKAAGSGVSIANVLAGYGTDRYSRDACRTPSTTSIKSTRPRSSCAARKNLTCRCSLNTEQMPPALKSLSVPTQLVTYPGQFHGVTTPSYIKDRYVRYLS